MVVRAPPAAADDETATDGAREQDHDRAERARQRGDIRPLEEIMPIVRERFTGDIAQVELKRDRGVWIYEFKLIDPAGRLIEVKVDALSGKFVNGEGE